MNFTTDLPKRNPLVSYIVASAMRCEKFFPGGEKNGGPVFRMHAVILKTGHPARKLTPAQKAAAAAQSNISPASEVNSVNNANQKQRPQQQMNPQDDSGSSAKSKQLYICCHIR